MSQPDDEDKGGEPPCMMHLLSEADISGYASRTEVLAFLDELLEAERAGARVTMETAKASGDGAVAELMTLIWRDEVGWCGVLLQAIKTLGGTPSHKTGGFYEKAIAITDIRQRAAFINRGQGWVVRKITAMLPRISEPVIAKELDRMLKAHRKDIDLVDARLS